MRDAPAGLIALLNSRPPQMVMADLFTFTLLDGTVLRYTSYDGKVTLAGPRVFVHDGPQIERGSTSIKRGLEVDTLDLTVNADTSHLVNGIPILRAIAEGAFNRAAFVLEKVFASDHGQAWEGPLVWFVGRVSEAEDVGRASARLIIRSKLEDLNIKLPKNLIQAPCRHVLFDTSCALDKATFGINKLAAAGCTALTIHPSVAIAQADGYFDLGTVTFTAGANAGISRGIRKHIGGVIYLTVPLPNVPNAGDAFTLYPGCDKLQTTCTTKFSNIARFGGMPYVPVPETAL